MCGTGVTMARDGVLAEWLRWVVLILTGSLDRDGGMRFNRGAINRLRPPRDRVASVPMLAGAPSRPELPRLLGQLPAVALAGEIEAGRIRALVLTGGNPITAFPEPDRMRTALQTLDALVVIDVMESELCELATHVLPATGQLERADLTLAEATAVRSGLQATGAVVAPVADRRSVWWMLGALSQRMGIDALGGAEPDSLTDELFLRGVLAHATIDADDVFAAGPRGVDIEIEYGWVRSTMLRGGRWNLAPGALLDRLAVHVDPGPDLVVTPRREIAWSNSVVYAGAGNEPTARVSPADAARAGLATGHTAVVASAHGSLRAQVAVDPNLREGVVSITHGRRDDGPGQLTSTQVDVDPISTMPLASGVPVTITAVTR